MSPLTLYDSAKIIMDDVDLDVVHLDIETPTFLFDSLPAEARFGITWERGFEEDMIPLLDRRHLYETRPAAKMIGKKPWETPKGYDQRAWRRPRHKKRRK